MQINKLILVPLLAAIASFIKASTGYEIGDQQVDMAADGILWVIMVVGIWMNRHKKTKPEVSADAKYPDLSDAL